MDDPTIIIIKDYPFQELRVLGRPSGAKTHIKFLVISPFIKAPDSTRN